jgi:hypothetical protein
MSEITLFPAYSEKENVLTNNVMLLLKTLYNESVPAFDRVVSKMAGLKSAGFGVRFEQQAGFSTEKMGNGVADGRITQEPVTLFIETKTGDWFSPGQIERYREFLKNNASGTRAVILLSDFKDGKKRCEDEVLATLSGREDATVKTAALSFDELLSMVREEAQGSGGLIPAMLRDFEVYLSNAGLLPDWENLLDIIPCRPETLDINKAYSVYACPNTGGPYYHRRAKYIGFYHDKKIDHIALIDAVLNIKAPGRSAWEIQYHNNGAEREALKDRAAAVLDVSDFYGNNDLNDGRGILLFLLSEFRENINFKKISPGGIAGRGNMLFTGLKDLDDLTRRVQGKTWKSFLGGPET